MIPSKRNTCCKKDDVSKECSEKELKVHDNFYQNVVENSNDGIVIVQDHRIKYLNPKFSEMVGYSKKELFKTPFNNIFTQKEVDLINNRYEKRLQNDQDIPTLYEANLLTKSNDELPVEINSSYIEYGGKPAILAIFRNISKRKNAEKKLQLNLKRLKSITNIFHYETESVQDLLDYSLGEAIKLTGSEIGYIYYFDENKSQFILNSWSKNVMDACNVVEPRTTYNLENTGIWGEAVRQHKPFIVNDFQAPNPLKKGYPDGHVELYRYMTSPVFSEGKIVAVVGVANKKSDYEKLDLLQLSLLMSSVWKIAENKLSGDALKLSEAKLKDIFENTPVGIFQTNSKGEVITTNKAMARIVGASSPEHAIAHYQDLGSQLYVDPQRRYEFIQILKEKGYIENFEYEAVDLKGNKKWLLMNAKISEQFADGELLIDGFTLDVTERKKAERTLKESENKFRSLVELSIDGIFIETDRGTILDCNSSACKMFGYTKDEIIGLNIADLVPESYREHLPEVITEEETTGNVAVERLNREKDGSIFPTEINTQLFELDGKKRLIAYVRDISERKKSDALLKESEIKYKNVFENANDVIFINDFEGNFLEINKMALEVWSYDLDEIMNLKARDLISTKDREKLSERLTELLNNEYVVFDVVHVRKDGLKIPTETNAKIIEYGGKPAILSIARDVRERKKAEKAIIQAKLDAENANAAKNKFLATMSHELRTPLNSVIGFSDMLLNQSFGELSEKQIRYVSNISKSGKHLLELINSILDISKIEAGEMDLHIEEILIFDIIDEVAQSLAPLAIEKGVCIFYDVSTECSTLRTDKTKFKQILCNLIENAIKFTSRGGSIIIDSKVKDRYLYISVSDDGIGISQEDQKKVFEPFVQLDRFESRQQPGTGLGLSVAKKFVEMHNGALEVDSEIGKGSIFTVKVPIGFDQKELDQ